MGIGENILRLRGELPSGVGLVAVSKFNSVDAIMEAYGVGQRVFGESRVQELLGKVGCLPGDIEWHFIGHLQSNKVRFIVPFIGLIHSVDSVGLLSVIDREAARVGRVVDCLLEVRVACEVSKFGFSLGNCRDFVCSGVWRDLVNVRICGLMCMASNTDDMGVVRGEFGLVRDLFVELRDGVFGGVDYFKVCSWGMTHDYGVAVEVGSTLVRIGSGIFGERMYR